MRQFLLAALLLIQAQAGVGPVATTGSQTTSSVPFPRFHPKYTGPFSFDINQPTRAAFETIAARGGVSIIFDGDWQPAPAVTRLKLDNVDIYQALDRMSAATNTFWTPVGNQTILVSDSNVTKHRDYDPLVLKVVHLTGPKTQQELNTVLNTVRQTLSLQTIVAAPRTNALVFKETPAKVALAEKLIADLDRQMNGAAAGVSTAAYETDAAGHLYVLDGSGQDIHPARSQLQPVFTGSFSLDINEPARAAFETIAAKAGLSIVFDRDYVQAPATVTLKLSDVDFYEALGLMSVATKSFWVPLGNHAIFVTNDNSTKRRDYDPTRVEVIQLTGTKTAQELNDVMNAVRQTLNVTTMTANPATNSLILRDTPAKAALVERLVADLDGQMNGQVYIGPAVDLAVSYESGSVTNTVVFDDSQRNFNPSSLQLPPSATGPFSFDINQPVHTAYETIAAKAGISVVFDLDFLPTPATIRMKLNDIDIFTALDRMAMASRTFWLPFGNQTIFVTADNSTKRRDYDPTKLEVIPLTGAKTAQQLNDVMNAVRQNLNVTTMTAFPRTNSLILRDTPAKVALVEKLLAVLDGQLNGQKNGAAALVPTASFEAGTVTNPDAFDASQWNIHSSSSQFRPASTGPFSFDVKQPIRSAFETIAAKAGLTVVFDPDYAPSPATITMKLNAIDIYTALDRVAMVSHTFWLPLGNQAVFVTADNSTKHRDYDQTKLEVIQLAGAKTTQELNDVMNAVRQNLNMTTMVANPATNSLIFRDTPAKVARAEKLIAVLDGQMKGQLNGAAAAVHTASFESGAIGNGYVLDGSRNMNSSRSQLQPASTGPFSFDINQPARSAYEFIAAKAGLSVVFDRDYLPPAGTSIELKLNDVDIVSALNRMSMVSHTFWLPLGNRTIFVSENTLAKHRNFDPLQLEVIPLTGMKTAQELDGMANTVRAVLNISSVYSNPRTNSLVLLDTPDKVSTAEKLVAELDALTRAASGASPQSVPILSIDMESQGTLFDVQNAGLRRYLTPAGSRLQPTTRLPFSLHMNEDSSRAYEILGETAGLNVIFDPNFVPGPPTAFRFDNLDIFHALDLLSMQTRNIWDVADSKTIIVASEGTATFQLPKDPSIHKTFHLTNATTPQDFDSLSILLRSMLNVSDLKADRVADTIEVSGNSATVALAEKLIAVLDKPAPAR